MVGNFGCFSAALEPSAEHFPQTVLYFFDCLSLKPPRFFSHDPAERARYRHWGIMTFSLPESDSHNSTISGTAPSLFDSLAALCVSDVHSAGNTSLEIPLCKENPETHT